MDLRKIPTGFGSLRELFSQFEEDPFMERLFGKFDEEFPKMRPKLESGKGYQESVCFSSSQTWENGKLKDKKAKAAYYKNDNGKGVVATKELDKNGQIKRQKGVFGKQLKRLSHSAAK